ncbi:hypothetical protein HDU87_008734 [Geranomyces variabilis]|uniref:Uncharacterized protein n=1 Tax=Geranomyces variabilis TaxID=109894 RepID=A0AAD5TCP1_9FUNG|nr:hypothetical protein HDU87_008734 [Geranomyces variabilis]
MYLHASLPVMTFTALPSLGIRYRNSTLKVHTWEHGRMPCVIYPDSELSTLTPRKTRKRGDLNASNAVVLVGWNFDTDVIDPNTVLRVTFTEFERYFSPAYAQTVHITEGATIDGDYTIVNHEQLSSVNMLYTALSRCRDRSYLHLVQWKYPAVDKDALAKRLQKNVGNIFGSTWSSFIAKTKLPRGYSWYDYGLDLHIDHIKSREEYKKEGTTDEAIVNHFRNLQVLRLEHNVMKKDSPVGYEKAETRYPAKTSDESDESDASDGSGEED